MIAEQIILSVIAGLIDNLIRTILSVPFCPYHFVKYHFVHTILSNTILTIPFCQIPFRPYTILSIPFYQIPFCLYTILSNTILSIYHFVHRPLPFCQYDFVCYHFVLEPRDPTSQPAT